MNEILDGGELLDILELAAVVPPNTNTAIVTIRRGEPVTIDVEYVADGRLREAFADTIGRAS